MKKLIASGILVSMALMTLSGVALIVVSLTSTPAEAGAPCRCPLIVAPVMCDNGKTYINQCEANCHHARNCVPTGGLSG